MERQTSENNDLPVAELESLLKRLTTNESPKTHNVKLHADPDIDSQNTSLHSPELNRETTFKAQNLILDNTVSSGTYDESQTKTSETSINNVFSSDFPKWERRRLPPSSLFTETWKEEELGIEEPMKSEDALSSFNRQTESPHYGETCVSHLPESSERDNVLQTELKDELLDDAWGYSPKCLMSSGAVNTLTHQTHATITSRTARSASDPVVQKPKEHRPLSAPSIFYVRDKEFANKVRDPCNTKKASTPERRKDSGKEESLGLLEHEMSKIQNKAMKNKKKLWEKHNCERNGSKRSQDSMEEEAQSVEMETEAPPLPPKKARYVRLARTCSLKDFKLNLEPINLMEEIFTGEEWSSFLRKNSSPLQKDTGDQAMADDVVRPDIDTELHVSQGTAEQNQSEDRHNKFNDNQADKKQDIINHTGEKTCAPDIINYTGETTCAPDIINDTGETMSNLDNKAKVNKPMHTEEVEPNAKIFAIPKALLTNAAKQRRVCGMYSETGNSDDVYDFMIHKCDFLLMKRMLMNDPLDFSSVKSFGLLDNSALKSRIPLSKKRHHRPPKKQKKEKAHRINSTFYKIPF